MKNASRSSPKALRGFTLIELIVVMAIFAVISIGVIANYSRYDSSMLLGSLAYDIALSVREAQVYGLSVKGYSSNFQVGYGIRFANSSTYTFFADTNANKVYDSGVDSIIDTYSVGGGHSITRYCTVDSLNQTKCSDDASPIHHLDVVFFRPDPDANISSDKGSLYSSAKIVVASPSGETRTVTIQSTGQISVTNP